MTTTDRQNIIVRSGTKEGGGTTRAITTVPEGTSYLLGGRHRMVSMAWLLLLVEVHRDEDRSGELEDEHETDLKEPQTSTNERGSSLLASIQAALFANTMPNFDMQTAWRTTFNLQLINKYNH